MFQPLVFDDVKTTKTDHKQRCRYLIISDDSQWLKRWELSFTQVMMMSAKDIPIRTYKAFLKRFNSLKDCSWFWEEGHEQRDRFTNLDLEYFRNHPKQGVIYEEGDNGKGEKTFKGKFSPRLEDLQAHRSDLQKKSTIWMSNAPSTPVLMMLFDVDDKQGTGNVEGAAKYISQTHFDGRTYVERSTGGAGKHIYFFVDVEFIKKPLFNEAIKAFAKAISADVNLRTFGVTFDPIPVYGIPTLWDYQEAEGWKIADRGNQLKCPYCPNGMSDISCMEELANEPLSGQDLLDWHASYKAQKAVPKAKTPSLSPPTPPQYNIGGAEAGPLRRARLFRQMKLANPGLTEDQFVENYTILTPENGGESKVRADFRAMDRKFVVKPKSSFDRYKYLEAAKTIPPLALHTPKRRSTITYQRVADFIAVKVQDAFQQNMYQGIASRDATLANWRVLRDKGVLDWTLDSHAYTRLLKLCCEYDLLEIHRTHRKPLLGSGKKVGGLTRGIGPGKVLKEEYELFKPIADELSGRNRMAA